MAYPAITRSVLSCLIVLAFSQPAVFSAFADDKPEAGAVDDPFSVLGFDKKPGEANPATQETPTAAEPAATPQVSNPVEQPADQPQPSPAELKGDAAATPEPSPAEKKPEGDLSIFGLDEAQMDSSEQTPEQQRHRRLIEAILERLESTKEQVRLEAAVALKETAEASDVAMLAQSLKSGGGLEKQVFVGETLGELHDSGATLALRNEVEHGELPSQISAARALGKLGNDYPVPLLSGLVSQPVDENLALSAIASLGRIGSNTAVYALKNSTGLAQMNTRGRVLQWALLQARNKGAEETTKDPIAEGRRLDRLYHGTRYLMYYPDYRRKPKEKTWLLVCVHGENLDVDTLFSSCIEAGRKLQMAVVAPYFDYMEFPDYNEFNIRGSRADKRMLEILDEISKTTDINIRQFNLYGFGKGAEFVHRFALAYPSRVAKAAVSYTDSNKLIDLKEDVYFPEGLKTNPFAPDLKISMEKAIAVNLVFLKSGLDTRGVTPIDRYHERARSVSNQVGIKTHFSLAPVTGNGLLSTLFAE